MIIRYLRINVTQEQNRHWHFTGVCFLTQRMQKKETDFPETGTEIRQWRVGFVRYMRRLVKLQFLARRLAGTFGKQLCGFGKHKFSSFHGVVKPACEYRHLVKRGIDAVHFQTDILTGNLPADRTVGYRDARSLAFCIDCQT